MTHTSKMDRKPHSSVTMEDPEGNKVATGHVTVDESEQEVRILVIFGAAMRIELADCP
jgi:hypothetical protein